MRILGCALAALLLTAAPAAAAPWSVPASIPGAGEITPLLAADASGPRAVYWDTLSLATPGATSLSAFVSVLGPGLQPGPAQPLSPAVNAGAALVYGNDRVALDETQIGVATGPLAGPLAVHPLKPDVLAIAGDAAGDLAALTEPCAVRFAGCDATAPSVVIGRRGHALGRSITLDRNGHAYSAGLAMDAHGRILAAWDRGGHIYARFISAAGKLSPIQRLGVEGLPPKFDVVLSNDGRAAVAWTAQSVDEGDATSPFTAKLALAGSSGRFRAARTLATVPVTGTGRYVPYQGLVVRLPAGRPGLAAWSGYDGTHFVVRAAPLTGASVGAAQTVSAPATDTVLADAAESAHGQAVILLLPGRAGNDPPAGTRAGGLLAATHGAGTQTFGAPEDVLPGPADVDGASVAIDATSGSVFATWRQVGSPVDWSVRAPLG
jgi:hypothetical protein